MPQIRPVSDLLKRRMEIMHKLKYLPLAQKDLKILYKTHNKR